MNACAVPDLKLPFADACTLLALACTLIAPGCTSDPVPVSESDAGDYRKAGPTESTPPRSPGQAAAPVAPASETKPSPTGPAASTKKPAGPAQAASSTAPKSTASLPRPVGSGAAEEGDWRPDTYTVKRGDTLYSIALDHGLDYKEVVAWNQLADANVIKVNQQLKLRPPPGWKPESTEADEVIARPLPPTAPIEPQPLEPPPAPKSQPKGIKVPYSEDALAQLTQDPRSTPSAEAKPPASEPKPDARPQAMQEPKTMPPVEPPVRSAPVVKLEPVAAKVAPRQDERVADQALQWGWPATGKLLHGFNQGSNPKGVAIGGTPGQAVFATAAGKVVYSGSGLRGYGKLIIIKHNSTYLSVYAHNRELLVKEGERVSKGQKIAEMGSKSADGVALHFEIRRLGKPVDPLKFLPQEGTS